MTTTIEFIQILTCPHCNGTGQVLHTYTYKPQHRGDSHVEIIERREVCSLCSGLGAITQEVLATWQQVQASPICPLCMGKGGKHFWSWDEAESGTRKRFAFEPCSICHGKSHISLDLLAQYEHERRKLRFWGVGCTLLVVVGGFFVLTQVVSILLARTPWLQCCAPPHVVFVTGIIVTSYKMGWF